MRRKFIHKDNLQNCLVNINTLMLQYILSDKRWFDEGIRKILAKYAEEALLTQNLSPPKLRLLLLTWLKKRGIDDALIQPFSGQESRKSFPNLTHQFALGDSDADITPN